MGFSLHADAQNWEKKCCMERNTEEKESVCLCACGRAGETESEELLLMVLFKSDLVAVRAVTYCRNTVHSLSSSSELWSIYCYSTGVVTVEFYVI